MIESPTRGCLLKLKYGWSWDESSNRETQYQKALTYSPTKTPSHMDGNTKVYDFEDYPFTTLVTQLRFHGEAKVVCLRYESIPGKSFTLEGYSIEGVTRKEPEADV